MRRYLACLLILCAGCARPKLPPDTLVLETQSDPSTLDPARAYDTTSIKFVRVMYNGLVDYDDNSRIVPAVAKSWRVSLDGRTYTFTLRPNVRFHSGLPVTAEDVRFSVERVLDPDTASDGLSFFQMIEGGAEWGALEKEKRRATHPSGITVNGPLEVSFRLKQPDSTFLNIMALPFGFIVPRETVLKQEKNGQLLSEIPDGCGPFKLVKWTHDAKIELVKNDDYYLPGVPKVSHISASIGGDQTLEEMRFELGAIDVASDIPPPDFARIMKSPQWRPRVQHAPMMDIRYLCMNNELKPFTDIRVRKAFNYAIDKERLVQVQSGRVVPARGILPEGLAAYNPKLRGYDYDPKKAIALLKEAGVKDLNLTLVAATVDNYPAVAQSIQQDLKKVGVTITLKVVNYKELKTLAGQRKKVPLCLLGWLQDYSDAANYLDVMFNGKNITPTASLNRAFYSNPAVNALLDKAAVERDLNKRNRMYNDVEQRIMNDAPWVPLYHSERYIMTQPWVTGYKLDPAWSARYERVAVNH